MRTHAAAMLVFLVLPSRAWADDKADCQSAYEEGQLARRDGRFDGARGAFAACQAEACPAAMRSRCAEFARDLEAAQPSVVVVVRDAEGADVRGATVRVDGAPAVEVSALGVRLNPGSHTLRVEAIDFRPSEKTVTLPEAFKNMPVAFVLERRRCRRPSHRPARGPRQRRGRSESAAARRSSPRAPSAGRDG